VRVVFDTNIFIAAFVLPGGSAGKAVTRLIDGRDQLVFSKDILDELLVVLARKFGRDREELARVAVFMHEIGEPVRPRTRVKVLTDDPDNRVLECAVAGNAEVIVTGDRALLRLGSHGTVSIVSLRDYLSSK
jgi:putative PIN family toxin of toxin-antitoxin system